MKHSLLLKILSFAGLLLLSSDGLQVQAAGTAIFDVRDYGATGKKADDARAAIQRALDACASAGGGMVRISPGEYTSGTLHLRSHVRLEIEAGATLFASQDPGAYDWGKIPSKAALLFGEDLEDVSITGRGTVDGQAEYEWREDDFEQGFRHKTIMEQLGKSLMRSVPKGFPKREVYPHLVWLGRSKDLRFSGVNFLHSPSWTFALYACRRAVFSDLYIYTSLKEAVWADGIDLDGCKDVTITRCTIETGDDCIALVSEKTWGPALVCEKINVSQCRLSTASAGVKFSEGNWAGIRNIRVSDTVFTNVNRGFAILTTHGGGISDVVLSDLTIDCNRFDWFWAGDGQPFFLRVTRLSELDPVSAKPGEPGPGLVQDITIRNVTAHAKGSSFIQGHAENWLKDIRLENLRLTVSSDPAAPFDQAENALNFVHVRNLTLRNVEVAWKEPSLPAWKSAALFQNVSHLEIDHFTGGAAWPDRDTPALVLQDVADATIGNARAMNGTKVFLGITGAGSRDIRVKGTDSRKAAAR